MQPDALTWSGLLEHSKESPHLVFPGMLSLLNGCLHKLKFGLQGKRIHIGRVFRLHGRLNVNGPGKIEIGDNCLIHSDIFGITSLRTNSKQATIRIGDNVGMNGTVIQCWEAIDIGDHSVIANAYISDSSGHSLFPGRSYRSGNDIPKARIKINRDVWISAFSVINRGVEIGEGSVIGALSFVNRNVQPNCLYAGSPAEFVKRLGE